MRVNEKWKEKCFDEPAYSPSSLFEFPDLSFHWNDGLFFPS